MSQWPRRGTGGTSEGAGRTPGTPTRPAPARPVVDFFDALADQLETQDHAAA